MGHWWIVLYLVLLVGLTLAFHYLESHRQTITFFATFLAAIAAISQLQATATQNREDVRLKKVAVSFQYLDRWSQHLRPLGKMIDESIHQIEGKTPEEAEKILAPASEQRRAVLSAFDFFEDAALAVKLRFADESTLCQYFSQPSTQLLSAARVWLEYHRTRTGQTGAYENYQWLAERWRKGCP